MRALCSNALFFVAMALVTSGCASGITQRDELKMAIQDFNDGIRWGKADQSASRLPLERRRTFAERYAALEDELEIMDYEVQRIEYDRSKDKAVARVDMSWSLKRRGLVERTVLEEEFQKVGSFGGGWMVVASRKVKGSPFPLLEWQKAPEPSRSGTPGSTPDSPPTSPTDSPPTGINVPSGTSSSAATGTSGSEGR